jgi:TRAP-type C4-dicarboxylate transport system substrate-binding protein
MLDIPMIYSNIEQSTKVMRESEWRTEVNKICEDMGTKLVMMLPVGYRVLTSDKEIKNFDSLKGMNIRTPNNTVFTTFWQKAGTNPTPLPLTEVYMALKQGLVDAQENPFDIILNNKFYEIQNYVTYTNHIVFNVSWLINLNFWNSLPPEYQSLFMECVEDTYQFAIKTREQVNQEYEANMMKNNPNIVRIYPDDEFKARLYDSAAACIPIIRQLAGDRMVDITLETMELSLDFGK